MSTTSKTDRSPVASGRFYSAHAPKLEIEIEELMRQAENLSDFSLENSNGLLALVAPHAGYVFSGIVAASAFLQLKNISLRKRIFLIGSSHHTEFNGASVYTIGDYVTPFGKVKVDKITGEKLMEDSEVIEFVQAAHAHEHSLEVMLPFIQYLWKDQFEIVPIVIATQNKKVCKKLAAALQPYFNSENLFIVSTDLSHYPDYKNALKVDKLTVDAIITGDPEILLQQVSANKKLYIPNLATSMCGWTSVITLMYLAESGKRISFKPILYQNSGDAKLYGESDRVVGYQSMAVIRKIESSEYHLSEADQNKLLSVASQAIYHYKKHQRTPDINLSEYQGELIKPGGAFVSIYVGNELRGCIGRMHSENNALVEIVNDVSVSAVFRDNRFTKLSDEELGEMKIEISVLTPLKKIESINEIELGKHGLYIKKGSQTGTFLPQVAEKTNWSVEEFVSNCSKNKAHLGPGGWKDADLYTYKAIVFSDK